MMPKDPTKNIFQYKIRGGHLNEFEYQQNQGQVKEQHDRPWEKENFDPNAALPGHDPASASPKAQAKGPRLRARAGKQPKPATASTRKQTGKAMKKATGKAVKKSAKTTAKSAPKKSTKRKALTARSSKKASTTRRSAKK
ncbi:MAG TPA: hypothetical protein VJV03_03490 [Pyrinomonadaceae bacterium]|nr:hypothetical protein [Pyrinomonadaceae bacterium]